MRIAPVLLLLGMACAHGAAGGADLRGAGPVEVTRAFYEALHRGDAAAAASLSADPGARPALEAFVELARAYADLEDALRDRFGPEAMRQVGYADRVAAEQRALGEARPEVNGDSATVTAGERLLATLRRVDGSWRVVLDAQLSGPRGAALAARAQATRRAAARVAPAIRAGLFDGPEDAVEAFQNELEVGAQGRDPDLPGPAAPERAPVTL